MSIETRDSQLFLLRVWPEEEDTGHNAWRGRVQHIVTGQVCSFNSWPVLAEAIKAMMQSAHVAPKGYPGSPSYPHDSPADADSPNKQ